MYPITWDTFWEGWTRHKPWKLTYSRSKNEFCYLGNQQACNCKTSGTKRSIRTQSFRWLIKVNKVFSLRLEEPRVKVCFCFLFFVGCIYVDKKKRYKKKNHFRYSCGLHRTSDVCRNSRRRTSQRGVAIPSWNKMLKRRDGENGDRFVNVTIYNWLKSLIQWFCYFNFWNNRVYFPLLFYCSISSWDQDNLSTLFSER